MRKDFLPFAVLFSLIMMSFALSAGEILLENPGFELDEDDNGIPDGWTRSRLSLIYSRDSAVPWPRSGSSAVKLCDLVLFQLVPALPDTYYAVRAYVRGDEGSEVARLGLQFDGAAGVLKRSVGERGVKAEVYRPIAVGDRSPPETGSARINLDSRVPEWVVYDDINLLSEVLDNPSFDEDADADGRPDGWLTVGEPVSGSGGVGGSTAYGVTADDFLVQEAAVCTDYDYLWTFRLKGDVGGESASLVVQWIGEDGENLGIDVITPTVGTDWSLFSIQARAPRPGGSGVFAVWLEAKVLSAAGGDLVWVDHVYLDKFLLVNETVSPNGDGVNDQAEIRLRLNEESSVDIILRNAVGDVVASVTSAPGLETGPHEFSWEIPSWIPSGTYEVEAEFRDASGSPRVLRRPMVIEHLPEYESIPPLSRGTFIRGVFITGRPRSLSIAELTLLLVDEAADLGANAAIVATRIDARDELLARAEIVGVSVVMKMQGTYGFVGATLSERGIDIDGFRYMVTPRISAIQAFPALLGYYTMDEPTLELAPRVFVMNRVFHDIDSAHPGLNTLNNIDLGDEKIELIAPPVYIFNTYPLSLNAPIGQLGDFPAKVEAAAALARTHGIPLWLVLQAFAKPNRRYPTRAETLCMASLALANGADGIFYFTLGSARRDLPRPDAADLYGLVDEGPSLAPMSGDVGEVFRILREHGDLFLELESDSPVGSATPPGYLATQRDSAGNPYLWLVNTDCLEPQAITAELSQTFTTGYDVLGNRPLRWENGGTRVSVDLPPGGAALVELGEEPPDPPPVSNDLVPAFGADTSYAFDLLPVTAEGPANKYLSMAFEDGLLYLRANGPYLEIWDLLSPSRGRLSRVRLEVHGARMRVSGDRLSVGDPTFGFALIDVSDPTEPNVLDIFMGHNGNTENCEIAGDTLFVAARNYGVYILDGSDPTDLQIVNRFLTLGLALDIRVRDGIAYVADGVAGLTIFDVADPMDLRVLSNLRIPGDDARQIFLRGDICYVIGKPTVVASVDVSDPQNPLLIHTEHTFELEKASLGSTTMVVADRVAGLAFLDVSMPGYPVVRGRARTDGFPVNVIYADNWLFTIDHESRFHQYYFEEPFATGVGHRGWTTYR